MLYKAEVKVTLKKGVLDPQGSTVQSAINSLGYQGVSEVRIGKHIELWVEADSQAQAESQVQELGKRILTNPIMETFTVTVAESQTGVK